MSEPDRWLNAMLILLKPLDIPFDASREEREQALVEFMDSFDLPDDVAAAGRTQAMVDDDSVLGGTMGIEVERERQAAREGFRADHDDAHDRGELAIAAAQYALPDDQRPKYAARGHGYEGVPYSWPFEPEAWKPNPDDRVRELVKAGALIAAEIDRLLRIRAREHRGGGEDNDV